MLRIIGCITEQHDLGLVFMAAPLCFFACFAATNMLERARAVGGNIRILWITAAGFLTGSGVWATHFVWMLAYKSSMTMGFDIHLVALSAVVASVLSGFAYWLALDGPSPLIASITMGAAVGIMHYVGMAAVELPADAVWSPIFVVASVAIGITVIYPGILLMTKGTAWQMQVGSAVFLTAGIATLHFTGMSAVAYIPDPTVPVPEALMDPSMLAIAIVAVVLSIIALGFAGSVFDSHLARHAVIEAHHLRIYVEELETTKRDLMMAKSEAEAGNRAKSIFLANMSHELRTPLNAIIGFSELMRGDVLGVLKPSKYAEYASDIQKSGQHLLSLINDILDLAKIEAGRRELDERELNLSDIAQRAINFVQPQAKVNRVEIRSNIDVGGTFWGDERGITQMLINLLSNAVKFSEPRDVVRIFASASEAGVMLGVEDQGMGMSQDGMKKALEPFGQATAMATIEGRGTGLGLPIVKALVEAHGGLFCLESEVKVGTRAWAVFPIERVHGQSHEQNHEQSLAA